MRQPRISPNCRTVEAFYYTGGGQALDGQSLDSLIATSVFWDVIEL